VYSSYISKWVHQLFVEGCIIMVSSSPPVALLAVLLGTAHH
jgi:hypothetical protein